MDNKPGLKPEFIEKLEEQSPVDAFEDLVELFRDYHITKAIAFAKRYPSLVFATIFSPEFEQFNLPEINDKALCKHGFLKCGSCQTESTMEENTRFNT